MLDEMPIRWRQGGLFQHKHQPVNKDLLEAELTAENYKEKFHQLLCREEEEHEKILKERYISVCSMNFIIIPRCDGPYHLKIYSPKFRVPHDAKDAHIRFGFITAKHLDGDKVSYAKHASEGQLYIAFNTVEKQQKVQVKVDYFKSKCEYGTEGFLLYFVKSQFNKLSSHFSDLEKSNKNIEIGKVSVSFILKYSYFDKLHTAVDYLPDVIVRKIMPDSPNCFTSPTMEDNISALNVPCPRTKSADCLDLEPTQRQALKSAIGCDGTKAPVLIFGSFGSGKTRLLARTIYHILYSSTVDKILICTHSQSTADAFMIAYFQALRNIGVEMIRVIPHMLHTTSYSPPKGFERYYVTARKPNSLERIKTTQVVLTSFLTSLHLIDRLEQGHFSHILLDEGAQSREPESIASLCLANAHTKIVIVGDHKQVRTTSLHAWHIYDALL